MMSHFRVQFCFLLLFVLMIVNVPIVSAKALWSDLPPTPTLSASAKSGYAPIHGAKIWYAVYGHGDPVILIHGGLANSNYWGYQVPVLAKRYQVIVLDSRGHGRSTNDKKSLDYATMTEDVVGLMDYLKIKRAAVVGWSDGAIIGIDMAIRHPDRITKLFAFGANSNPDGTKDISSNRVMNLALSNAKVEYQKYSTTPQQFDVFLNQVKKMWSTQPNFTKAQLNSITVPTWIVDGDHDEGIKREDTEYMAAEIPNAGLLILPNLSHFAFIQDPELFNQDVMHFLAQ